MIAIRSRSDRSLSGLKVVSSIEDMAHTKFLTMQYNGVREYRP